MPDISVGIVEQFLHPPIGLLTPHIDYLGPYSGLNTLTEWGTTPGPTIVHGSVTDTFGIEVTIFGAIPAGYGFTNGWVSPDGLYDESTYDQRLCQVVVQHQFLGGAWITTQIIDVHSFPLVALWDVSLPGRVGLLVAPGLEVDLFYLLVG
jgi:hypothetical protein